MPVSTVLAFVGVLLFSVRLTALLGVEGGGIGDSDPTYASSGVPGELMHERDVEVAGKSYLVWSTSNVYAFFVRFPGRLGVRFRCSLSPSLDVPEVYITASELSSRLI